ncbi:Ras-related protein RABA6b [Linum perenne]
MESRVLDPPLVEWEFWIQQLRHGGRTRRKQIRRFRHLREVSEADDRDLAEAEGISFMETSARDNVNVYATFLEMIAKIHLRNTSHGSLDGRGGNSAAVAPVSSLPKRRAILSFDDGGGDDSVIGGGGVV